MSSSHGPGRSRCARLPAASRARGSSPAGYRLAMSRRILALIDGFLKQEIMSDMACWLPTTGTPQGAVLSPLLANIYLHPLDLLMEQNGRRMVRYADDFVILCRTAAEATDVLREVNAWTTANGLTLHPDKTRIADSQQSGQGFEFLGYRFEAGQRFVRKKSLKALKDKGFPTTLSPGPNNLMRVLVGPYADTQSMGKAKTDLENLGFHPFRK